MACRAWAWSTPWCVSGRSELTAERGGLTMAKEPLQFYEHTVERGD